MYAFNGENLIFLSKFRRKNVENSILIVESCQFHLVCEILWKLSSMTGLQGVSLLRNRRPTPPPSPKCTKCIWNELNKAKFHTRALRRAKCLSVSPSVRVLMHLSKEEIRPFFTKSLLFKQMSCRQVSMIQTRLFLIIFDSVLFPSIT